MLLCGKNKKVQHETLGKCVTDVLVWSVTEHVQMRDNMESTWLCYKLNKEANSVNDAIYSSVIQ